VWGSWALKSKNIFKKVKQMVRLDEPLTGWILIDKQEGVTSMHVTHRIKRLFSLKKAGHAGTLDPLATGILPVALGQTTGLIPYVMAWQKSYLFTVRWGQSTTTDDCLGELVSTSSHRPSLHSIEDTLCGFQGQISQIPPLYCAAKIKGEPAYALARRGESVVLAPRVVTIFNLTVEQHKEQETTFQVTCGSGTYVRSLARDIAVALGTCGHVVSLRRTRIGQWDRGHALQDISEIDREARGHLVLPPQIALGMLPSCQVNEKEKLFLWQGGSIVSEKGLPEGEVVCYDDQGQLVALAKHFKGSINPFRCFIGRL
jgi:tRNA pseudouridine55 synthase